MNNTGIFLMSLPMGFIGFLIGGLTIGLGLGILLGHWIGLLIGAIIGGLLGFSGTYAKELSRQEKSALRKHELKEKNIKV